MSAILVEDFYCSSCETKGALYRKNDWLCLYGDFTFGDSGDGVQQISMARAPRFIIRDENGADIGSGGFHISCDNCGKPADNGDYNHRGEYCVL